MTTELRTTQTDELVGWTYAGSVGGVRGKCLEVGSERRLQALLSWLGDGLGVVDEYGRDVELGELLELVARGSVSYGTSGVGTLSLADSLSWGDET